VAVDGPDNGPAPALWDVNVAPIYGGAFVNKTAHVEVPHTATMKPCHQCQMQGKLTCNSCNVMQMCHAGRAQSRSTCLHILSPLIGPALVRRAADLTTACAATTAARRASAFSAGTTRITGATASTAKAPAVKCTARRRLLARCGSSVPTAHRS